MDSAILTVLVNAGTAGVVILLIIFGYLIPKWAYKKLEEQNKALREENNHLQEALNTERAAANDVAKAGQVTNQLISVLADIATERRHALPPAKDPGS